MANGSRHLIPEIYSDVLFQLAEEGGQVGQVLEDLAKVSDLLRDEHEFQSLLISGRLKDVERADILRRVFTGRVSDLTLDFLCVLSRRNRLGFITGIMDRYEILADSLKNCRLVEITLASQMADVQLEQLRQQIKDAIGAEVKLRVQVDPEILGGIVIRQGDLMIDHSVKTILDRTVEAVLDRSKEQNSKQKKTE